MQPTLMLSYFKTLFQPPPPSAPTSLISQHLSTWRQAPPLAEKEKEKHFLKTQRVGLFFVCFFFFSNTVFLIKVCALCVGFFGYNVIAHFRASLVAQTVKCLPTMRETWVQSLGWEDPLEKEMATHSSTLAWKIPWTEEPRRLESMGSQRVGHD